MEFSIYQAVSGGLTSAVVRLLEKVYLSGKHAVFFSPITERVDVINKALWTYSTNAFIPHGDSLMGFEDQQPIYFTDTFRNPNQASILVLVDTFDIEDDAYKNFEKIIIIFEDTSKINEAEKTYQSLKNDRNNVNYWKQSSKGWEKLS